MAIGTTIGNAMLDAILNNSALQKQAYASLHTADPGTTGASENSGNGYARELGSFATAASQATQNDAAITFDTATGDWTQSQYAGVWDALTVGNFIAGAALDTAFAVLNGQYAEYAIGALDIDFSSAGYFGNDTLDDFLDALFDNVSLQIAQAYFSLHTADPGGTGANEHGNVNGYARTALPFGNAAAKSAASDTQTDSPAATGSDWTQATHLGLWTSGTYGGGTFLWGSALSASITVQVGKVARIAVAGVNVSLT